jgi:hypothetical protein
MGNDGVLAMDLFSLFEKDVEGFGNLSGDRIICPELPKVVGEIYQAPKRFRPIP